MVSVASVVVPALADEVCRSVTWSLAFTVPLVLT